MQTNTNKLSQKIIIVLAMERLKNYLSLFLWKLRSLSNIHRKFSGSYLLNVSIIISLLIISLSSAPLVEAALPSIEGQSGIVMEVNTKKILYQKNIEQNLPMASTTKILTALVAIEKGNLQKKISTPRKAAEVDGSRIYLKPGEKQRLIDLLYGLMLRSGNDAAITIAEGVGGSEENFCKMMNEKAVKLGAKSSSFMNPHGLDHEKHYTTARDLGLITCYAMQNETFKKIVSTKKWEMPGSTEDEEKRILYNKNKMLYRYPNAIGVKTGYTIRTGRCLVTAAVKDNMTLVSVVLRDHNWWDDSKKILDYAFEKYESIDTLQGKNIKKYIRIIGGNKKKILCSNEKTCYYIKTRNENDEINFTSKIKLPSIIEAPVKKGEKLGEISIYKNGSLYKKVPIKACEGCNKLQNKKSNKFNKAINKILKNYLKF